jgi:putative heme iron utilization protein
VAVRPDPLRPPDDEARRLARDLLAGARTAALAVLRDGAPYVARVAFGLSAGGVPLTLVSDLSHHTRALGQTPHASLLIGDVPARGDPLAFPRLTLQARAAFVEKAEHRATWLARHPKARLYVDFSDFRIVRFEVAEAHLNAGFGKAYRLGPADLGLPEPPDRTP